MDPRRFDVHRPHPWHGVPVGPQAEAGAVPDILYAYVEITPFSTIKYEVDKVTGYLKVDRPQRSNSLPPYAYGFVPRTWCKGRVAGIAGRDVGGVSRGDGDPLDICVVSERAIDRSDILLGCRAVGGLLMVDNGEADGVFILNPVKVEQLKAIALNGEKMPPKTTYFYPKVLSGLTVYRMD